MNTVTVDTLQWSQLQDELKALRAIRASVDDLFYDYSTGTYMGRTRRLKGPSKELTIAANRLLDRIADYERIRR